VTGVVNDLADRPIDALTLAVALIAVVVGFGAWWTYFDFAGHRTPRHTPTATAQWMLTHLPLTASVAAMGAAMVTLVEHDTPRAHPRPPPGCCAAPPPSCCARSSSNASGNHIAASDYDQVS
jgi:low temperature requirement protein LtrA